MSGSSALLWVPLAAGLATLTIIAGNLMAIPQQNIKRLLAYSGIAHIGYMLIGFAAVSAEGVAMMLFLRAALGGVLAREYLLVKRSEVRAFAGKDVAFELAQHFYRY